MSALYALNDIVLVVADKIIIGVQDTSRFS